jgi:hypothetical protein
VVDPAEPAPLGDLVAAGPRAAAAPGEYAKVIESVREGYLLHYGTPRIIATEDRDLALLAGDYMYAEGLARLAALGDLEAVRELASLISVCAEAHVDGEAETGALWLASVVAIGSGSTPELERARATIREDRAAGEELLAAAFETAVTNGLAEHLDAAAKTVGFRPLEHR